MDHTRTLAIEVRILASIIMKVSTQALEQHLNTLDISISALQYGILRLVSFHSFTLTELSRKMLLDPSTLVPSVDSLVQKGFIIRERDPNDRRRMPLQITEAGTALLESTTPIASGDPLPLALEQLTADDRTKLQELLREVVMNLPEGEALLREVSHRISPDSSKPQC